MDDPYSEHGKPSRVHQEALDKAAARREARLVAKSQEAHTAPMVGTPREREERDQQKQWGEYQKWLNLHTRELLAGTEGEHFAALIAFLKGLTIEDAEALIDAVKSSIWLSGASAKTKLDALRLIDTAIIKLREKEGLPPFDDPLWDQESNAYLIIRKQLTGVGL